MGAFLYGVALQVKLDIRSKTMLITCYVVPLVFFGFMGGIFTSITPESKFTLIQSMTVFVVSMGALTGLPPSIVEIYGSNIKNVYKANGVPLYLGVVTQFISAFIHLMITCIIILLVAPIAFNATPPDNLPLHFATLSIFLTATLSIGNVLGLICKNQSKLTMLSQLIFLPSLMLSGIMFPAEMLPKVLVYIGRIFPATWGFYAMTNGGNILLSVLVLLGITVVMTVICGIRLSRICTV